MSVEASGGGASVGSSDKSGGNNVGDECRVVIDQTNEGSSDQNEEFTEQERMQFVSFEEASKVKVVVNKIGRPADVKPKIQKVPPMLRRKLKFRKYFQPKMFTLGPYNRPLGNYKMEKQIKVNLAAEFLQQNGVKKEDLYRVIKKQIKELKDCYDDDFIKDKDHELAWMFLEDGCAILQFMYIFVEFWDPETQFRDLGIKTDCVLFLEQDLFLLENQLPFQLLRLIIGHVSKQEPHTKEDKLLESIYEFIFCRFRTPFEWYENKREILKDLKDNHVHLLDLLRKKLIQPLYPIDERRDLIEIIIDCTVSLLDKLNCKKNKFDRGWVPFRNIGKLREDGINLKPSTTSCVGDISFSGGTLKLPPIIMEESSATMFLNMLGYEMCPDFQDKSEVSTYMYFMDKLIDRTQDVVELREKNILMHDLGSDEEVVELFNEISKYLSPDFKRYDKVKRDIDNYFDKKGLIWLHKISHDIHQYFKQRWSLLAFIGALLAVASTIIQTVITVLLAYQTDSKIGN